MRWIRNGTAVIVFALSAMTAFAQKKSCIVVRTVAETQQTIGDDRGHKRVRVLPTDKIAPGDQVIYTVSATNVCNQPAENAVIEIPVPEHMAYVGGSAMGPGTEVTFSVDGGYSFGKPAALKVKMPEGVPRSALARDYTHIRWVMAKPLQPEAVAFARFRAVLE
jgi:uncharacterized repeat protein (TIGR01451 family)